MALIVSSLNLSCTALAQAGKRTRKHMMPTHPLLRLSALRACVQVTAVRCLAVSVSLISVLRARITLPLLTLFPLIWSSQVWAQPATTSSSPPAPAPLFQIAGVVFKLDPSLLEAIALVESADRADAVSPKGAAGLMQLMPDTARRFGVKHPFDPVENVLGAARFLSYLREYAGIEDLPQLLAAYNAGEGAVRRYGGLPPYPETREYVRRVLLTYLLSDRPGSAVNGYGLNSPPVARLIVPQPDRPLLLLRRAKIVKPRTEADLFAQLAQIRSARNHALKLQRLLRKVP
jgi:Transglycosylase SLT domain